MDPPAVDPTSIDLNRVPNEVILVLLPYLDSEALVAFSKTNVRFEGMVNNFIRVHRSLIDFENIAPLNRDAPVDSEYRRVARALDNITVLVRFAPHYANRVVGERSSPLWPLYLERAKLIPSPEALAEYARAGRELYIALSQPSVRLVAFSPTDLVLCLLQLAAQSDLIREQDVILEKNADVVKLLCMLCVPRNTKTYAAPTFPNLRTALVRLVKGRATARQVVRYVKGLVSRSPRLDFIKVDAFVPSSRVDTFKPKFNPAVWIVTREHTPWSENLRYTIVTFKLEKRDV